MRAAVPQRSCALLPRHRSPLRAHGATECTRVHSVGPCEHQSARAKRKATWPGEETDGDATHAVRPERARTGCRQTATTQQETYGSSSTSLSCLNCSVSCVCVARPVGCRVGRLLSALCAPLLSHVHGLSDRFVSLPFVATRRPRGPQQHASRWPSRSRSHAHAARRQPTDDEPNPHERRTITTRGDTTHAQTTGRTR